MTPQQIELARHALGLGRSKKSYRNHFVTGPGSSDFDDWESMVKAGMAIRRDGSTLPFGGDHKYWLTKQGAAAALREGETLNDEDFPDHN